MPRQSFSSTGGSQGLPSDVEVRKEPHRPRSPTYRHSSRHSQDIMQRIIDEYSAQVKPGWWKPSWRVKTIFEAETIDLYRYCENQLERLRMEKARLKSERLRLDKDRLKRLREYEAHYMEIRQYCVDKLEMRRSSPLSSRDGSHRASEFHRHATDPRLFCGEHRETNPPARHSSAVIPTPVLKVSQPDRLLSTESQDSSDISGSRMIVPDKAESPQQEPLNVSSSVLPSHEDPVSTASHSSETTAGATIDSTSVDQLTSIMEPIPLNEFGSTSDLPHVLIPVHHSTVDVIEPLRPSNIRRTPAASDSRKAEIDVPVSMTREILRLSHVSLSPPKIRWTYFAIHLYYHLPKIFRRIRHYCVNLSFFISSRRLRRHTLY